MYLAALSEEQKELFLDLSIFSMRSNGIVEVREQELAYQYCDEMNIRKRENVKNTNVDDVLKQLKKISTDSEMKKITVELVALMYADDDFADEEDELLMKLQNTFCFSSHVMGELIFATKHLLLSHRMLAEIVRE